MKKGKIVGLTLVTALLLTGCVDHMPEMTQEQSELVAEYAAGLLLKYSPNYKYGLADEDALLEETSTEEALAEESTVEETTEESRKEESSVEESTKETTPTEIEIHVGADKQDDVLYIPINNKESVELKENPYEVELAELVNVTDMGIRYTSYELCDEYPGGSSAGGFTVQPSQGKKLMVIHFALENKAQETKACDLFDSGIRIKVNLNENGFVKTMSTLLMNDITTYIEEMKPNASADVVTVIEVDVATEDEISSLNLLIESGGNKSALKLK